MNRFLPIEWIVATRFLIEGKAQTRLIIIGIAVGVAVIVFMSAILSSVQVNIRTQMLSTTPQVTISAPDESARRLLRMEDATVLETIQPTAQRARSVDQWQLIRSSLARREDVVAVAPEMQGAGIAVRGNARAAISIIGIEPENSFRIVDIPAKLVSGEGDVSGGHVVIGVELAKKLGVGLRDRVRLVTGDREEAEPFIVTGLFDLGQRGANETLAYVSLRSAQTLLGAVGGVSQIKVRITDPDLAQTTAAEIAAATGMKVDNWIDQFADLFSALRAQTLANYAIRFFVALSVALGIASVLAVSVVQRSREIGILRAMGARRGQILWVFLAQGAVLGLIGSIVGSVLGYALIWLWRIFGRTPAGKEYFPVIVDPNLFLYAAFLATLTGLIAAVIPARRASRLNPVEAIHV
jgi:lipoprotein-releasing system permease protein